MAKHVAKISDVDPPVADMVNVPTLNVLVTRDSQGLIARKRPVLKIVITMVNAILFWESANAIQGSLANFVELQFDA
jgi:hypothetical protein